MSLPITNEDPEKSSPIQDVATRRKRSSVMRIARGIEIPPHMISPGKDGYRTPTIEDYEFHRRQSEVNPGHVQFHTPNYDQTPPQSAKSPLSRAMTLLEEKLEWKERIRHFTWGFFSSTMATGGIASILYQGI